MFLLLVTALAYADDAPAAPGFSMTEMWGHAGWVARSVLVVLFLMFLASVFTAIERAIAFNRARSQSMMLAAQIVGPLQTGDIPASLKLASDQRFKSSYLAALLRNGLTELNKRQDRHGLSAAHRAVEKSMAEEGSKLRRGMTILATTGSTAPFVGLFGTTFGVINAFSGMATAGSGLASISAGISEALITTAFGILVAVIGVWLFNYFNLRIEKVMEELSSSEADFIDWAEKLLITQSESHQQAGK